MISLQAAFKIDIFEINDVLGKRKIFNFIHPKENVETLFYDISKKYI